MSGKRGNSEGSIYPYRNGFAAYVWVTTPTGKRERKYVYGKTRPEVHDKWLKLHAAAKAGPVATSTPTLATYLAFWLKEEVEANLKPLTAATYETAVRLYIVPFLGAKRVDKLNVRDVREWLNKLAATCQCCAQGKDERRPTERRRCCAIGKCCERTLSKRSVADARTVIRSALTYAISEEMISRNVAQLVKMAKPRPRKVIPWSADEASRFLESARTERDPLYGAYVMILVLGLRKGEVLGLRWQDVMLDRGEILIEQQLQRVRRRLLHSEVKTDASEAVLPLPDVCRAALLLRQKSRDAHKLAARELWTESDLVFTTKYGTPIEPRNFNRRFEYRCEQAGVRLIRVHDTRKTCGTLLAALDVHPRVAMQILRHSQFAVTMEIYTQVPSEQTRNALKKLGASLDGSSTDPASVVHEDGPRYQATDRGRQRP
ncbi:tyrosine-type recombinase/integrase [Embleya sp. NPDC059237]|uniref:tyrosine-type recombinase/integrase n=1 Tax=Embleya sp. NPDC059237 TaxID=3346784 RepID=UPI00369EDABB